MDDISIDAKNISKNFTIYHDRASTMFEYLNSFLFRKKQTEKLDVLQNISFEVKKGEMLGIIGFNGSGKTTLLKIIANIIKPNSGKITVSGKVIPFLELGTGFNGELTAKENIVLYGLLLGFSKKEIKKKVQEIIKFAELEKFLDTKLKNFSSGMYARLAFSTAIQVDPDILLVDEVLSVGDISFQEKSFKKFHFIFLLCCFQTNNFLQKLQRMLQIFYTKKYHPSEQFRYRLDKQQENIEMQIQVL